MIDILQNQIHKAFLGYSMSTINQVSNKKISCHDKFNNPELMMNLLWRILSITLDEQEEIYRIACQISGSPFTTMIQYFCKTYPEHVEYLIDKLIFLQQQPYKDKDKGQDIRLMFSTLRKIINRKIMSQINTQKMKSITIKSKQTTNKQKYQIPNINNKKEKKSEAQSSSLNEESGAKRTKGVFLLLKSWFMGLTQSQTSFAGQFSDVTDRVNDNSQNKNNFFQNKELERQPLIQSQKGFQNIKTQLETKPIQQSPLVNNKTKNKCQKAN